MNYIFYNPKCKNGLSKLQTDELVARLQGEIEKLSVLDEINYKEFFDKLNSNDKVYLIGGDGTLNHFVNNICDIEIKNDVYFYSAGTGNDFKRDVYNGEDIIKINEYIKDLPTVYVNGMKRKFINGIGYGIDGYCCLEGDRLQSISDKPVNYTAIAIKGLLFKYKRPNAIVTIDGVSYKFKKVYLAPTMKGRYYGGGMNVAPSQTRDKKTLSCVVGYGVGKLHMLMVFPNIFKGEHLKSKAFKQFDAKHVVVEFDRPTALQIDGETVKDVSKYEVIL